MTGVVKSIGKMFKPSSPFSGVGVAAPHITGQTVTYSSNVVPFQPLYSYKQVAGTLTVQQQQYAPIQASYLGGGMATPQRWGTNVLLLSLIEDAECEKKFQRFYEQLHSNENPSVQIHRVSLSLITHKARVAEQLFKWTPRHIYGLYDGDKKEELVDLHLAIFTTKDLLDVAWQHARVQ